MPTFRVYHYDDGSGLHWHILPDHWYGYTWAYCPRVPYGFGIGFARLLEAYDA